MPSGDPPPFERLLIANRGEIAVRVDPGLRRAGHPLDRVYSEADRGALHTRLADEAHLIGPGPARESYLSIPTIVEVARATGAQAIHPGYGFLSENPAFAEACAEAGLAFVGPSPAAMRLLGDKAAARRLAAAHGVPIVPGYDGADQDDRLLAEEAARIGFPLLVKAAAGGGGRGMRVGADAERPRRGAGRRPPRGAGRVRRRHADPGAAGRRGAPRRGPGARRSRTATLIHLGERDCSVQRRHQKVIEESPAPGVTPELRAALGEAAIRVARAAGYTERRHLRVPAGRQRRLLVHRDERPPPGRAPGHRAGDRLRPRARADRDRGRPAARAGARRTSTCAATPSSAASTPRTRPATTCPSPGTADPVPAAARPRAAPRRRLRRRRRRAAVLRHDARQADRLRRGPRQRDRPGTRGARPVRRRGRPDESRACWPGSWTIRRSARAAPRPTSWRPRARRAEAQARSRRRRSRRPSPGTSPCPSSTAGTSALGDWRLGGQGVVTFWLPERHARRPWPCVADREDRHTWLRHGRR